MSKRQKPTENVRTSIQGDVKGQIAIGSNISQSQSTVHQSVSEIKFDQVHQILMDVREKLNALENLDKKDAALERVDELEQAIKEEEQPDLATMEYVKNWFGKNVPALAGMVTSVVVHPIVGKLVEAGGDLLVKDFNQRFGGEG